MLLIFQSYPWFSSKGTSRPLWQTLGVIVGMGLTQMNLQANPGTLEPPPALRIGYVSELPVSWSTGLADPIHNIARSLGSTFVKAQDEEFPLPTDNLVGVASWEELARQIQLGSNQGADLFPIQSYEFVEFGKSVNIKPLLIATRNNHWQTNFQVLVSPTSGIQSLAELKGRKILVHRDGAGYLVDYWLDNLIARRTGEVRKGFAWFQTVTQPREAMLPVFFGEADACVVSIAAFNKVVQENQPQLSARLRTLPEAVSEAFPTQVIVCRADMPEDKQRLTKEHAIKLAWTFGDDNGGFIPAEAVAFDHLNALLAERGRPLRPVPVPQPPAGAKLQTSNPGTAKPIRRP